MSRAFRPFLWAILLTLPGLFLRFLAIETSPIVLAAFAVLPFWEHHFF